MCALVTGLVVGALACSRGGAGPAPPDSPRQSAAACSPGTPRQAAALVEIDAALGRWATREGIPRLAAGIVCRDVLIWSAGYGVRAIDDSTPVTPATQFPIGPLTQLFTATAILQLRDAGHLNLDDPVRRHLLWFRMMRSADVGDTPITIRHLLTHTSGLPRDSHLTDFPRRSQAGRDETIAALLGESLEATPGTRYAFSNLGHSVLGEIITAVTGLPFATVIRDSLLLPLGMRHTLVRPNSLATFLTASGPLTPIGFRRETGFRDRQVATPTDELVSSVEDLSRFVVMQLAPYVGADPVSLADSSVFAMHRIQFGIDSALGGSGFEWMVDTSHSGHLVYHGGGPEQNDYLVIDLTHAIGIILLTDARGVDIAERAAETLTILRGAFP